MPSKYDPNSNNNIQYMHNGITTLWWRSIPCYADAEQEMATPYRLLLCVHITSKYTRRELDSYIDVVCLLLDKPFAAVWSQPGVVCSKKVTFDPLTR